MPVKPHRGGAILALGIVGICLTCIVTGIIAWVMGRNDLAEMNAGRMDREGYSLTQAGMICGIIGTVLGILSLGYVLFMVVLVGMLGVCG
jgi:hypothetical protein